MIEYRRFRNTDPPALAELWNTSLPSQRIIPVRSATLLEYFTFAKSYFDYDGLIVASDGVKLVGFVHAGFGPGADHQSLDRSTGVICTLGVLPSVRRQGVGTELLARAEAYLLSHGAKRLLFGSQAPNNPFLFGLQGGCTNLGVVVKDEGTAPFLARHRYEPGVRLGVFRRSLARLPTPMDTRFGAIRSQYDILASALRYAGWWLENVLGPVEAVQYRLQDKTTGASVARMTLWDMDTFCMHWGESCVGLIDMHVEPDSRQSGLGKYLLVNVLRHLRDRSFAQFEAACSVDDSASVGLLRALEFEHTATGVCFHKVS